MAKVAHKFSRKVFAEVKTESWFSIIFSRTGIPLATTAIFIWWFSERIQVFRYLKHWLNFSNTELHLWFLLSNSKTGKNRGHKEPEQTMRRRPESSTAMLNKERGELDNRGVVGRWLINWHKKRAENRTKVRNGTACTADFQNKTGSQNRSLTLWQTILDYCFKESHRWNKITHISYNLYPLL